jgi:hypothetical protein
MATLQDLFKKQKSDLYSTDKIRIDSLGLINPPRGAALLTSSPNALADLIGNQVGGLLKGSANRPSDTIFKSDGVLSKPISLFKTQQQLKDAIQSGDVYFVKDNPAPASLFAKYKQGANSPTDMAMNLAKDALNNIGGKKGKANALKEALKKKNEEGQGYGTKYKRLDIGTKPLTEEHKFTKWYPKYTEITDETTGIKSYAQTALGERTIDNTTWDDANSLVMNTESFPSQDVYNTEFAKHKYANQAWVSFKKYGTNEIIPFVGSVTGIAEDVTPEWSDYKYIGSPYKIYKYTGVERTLKFDLKLYYTTEVEKTIMVKKINFLKSLAFPFDNVVKVEYPGLASDNSPMVISPNLIKLSISGLYKNLLGIIESLSFSIEDTTTWGNNDFNMEGDLSKNGIYPNLISVNVGMKIIENHVVDSDTITKYRYNFDGYNTDGKEYIETTVKEENI